MDNVVELRTVYYNQQRKGIELPYPLGSACGAIVFTEWVDNEFYIWLKDTDEGRAIGLALVLLGKELKEARTERLPGYTYRIKWDTRVWDNICELRQLLTDILEDYNERVANSFMQRMDRGE